MKDILTYAEAESLYKYELANKKINTCSTPHYDGFLEFVSMLNNMGIEVTQ
jgi:saccharopine dehydrogenase-like NADP-dependent oxidoreductase